MSALTRVKKKPYPTYLSLRGALHSFGSLSEMKKR